MGLQWIDVKEAQPTEGQNVIAVGTWVGEINGVGEDDYMGIGKWKGDYVDIDSDTYSTWITNVTHWMALPRHP